MYLRNYYIFNLTRTGYSTSNLTRFSPEITNNLLLTKGIGTIHEQYSDLSPKINTSYGCTYWSNDTSTDYTKKFIYSGSSYKIGNDCIQDLNTNLVAYSNPYNTNLFQAKIVVGEGTPNDTTPVTLLDQDITNKVFDDRITLYVNGTGNGFTITMTNITSSDINIREIGFYTTLFIGGISDHTQYPNLEGDFVSYDYSSNTVSFPILLAKVKLAIPAAVPANGTKTIHWSCSIPTT